MNEGELVELALEEADRGLAAAIPRLVDAARKNTDLNVLVHAAHKLARSKRPVDDGRTRIAFAYLTTAQRRLVDGVSEERESDSPETPNS